MQVGFPWMFHCHAGLAGSIRVSSGAKVRVCRGRLDVDARTATPFFVSGVSIPQKWVLYNDFFLRIWKAT